MHTRGKPLDFGATNGPATSQVGVEAKSFVRCSNTSMRRSATTIPKPTPRISFPKWTPKSPIPKFRSRNWRPTSSGDIVPAGGSALPSCHLNVQSAGIFRSGISESTDHQQSSVYKATHLIQNYVGFILTATSQVGVEETTGRAAVGSDCPGLFVALEKAPGRISYDIEAEMFFRHAQESERR